MKEKPFVIYNLAMSLEGKISSRGGESRFSSEEDLDEVHRIRASVDAILVGVGTVLCDDPSLLVKRGILRNPPPPFRLVVDSQGRTPLQARVFNGEAPLILGVSQAIPPAIQESYLQKGAQVFICGETKVDLKIFLEKLYPLGIQKILLEGGGTLGHAMLFSGLVDELRVAISPVILGSEGGVSFAQGEGQKKICDGVELELLEQKSFGHSLALRYKVLRQTGQG